VRALVFAVLLTLYAHAGADAAAQKRRGPARRPATVKMMATAYCDHGTTKSGAQTRKGIVAADPRHLPIGTRLRILAPGEPYHGAYTVMDTGGAIKGRELDIFMPSCTQAHRFGRRPVLVRILRLGQ
jgi:3D (Asp-Asp-Asp) domain-containing protein